MFEDLLKDFFNKYHKRYCLHIMVVAKCSEETAEDLATNAYISALTYKDSYKEGNFVTYMMGVAKNIIRNYVSRGFNYWSQYQQDKFMDKEYNEIEIVDSIEHKFDELDNKKVLNKFALTLGVNKPTKQRMLLLKFLETGNYQESYLSMNMSPNLAGSQWSYILGSARQWMKKNKHGPELLEAYPGSGRDVWRKYEDDTES